MAAPLPLAAGSPLDDLVRRWTSGPTHPRTIRFFQRAVYAWLLLDLLVLLLPVGPLLWGPDRLGAPPPASGFLGGAFDLLGTFAPAWGLFVAGHVVALLCGLWGAWPRLSALAVLFFVKNLHGPAWMALNGGHNLVELMLLYFVFMNPNADGRGGGFLACLDCAVTNAAFLAARLQLAAVYLVAGLAKLQGGLWPAGVALHYVLNTDEYTLPVGRWLASSPVLVALGTYATLAFMISFPWLVWVRGPRAVLLAVGVLLHLQIGLIMGLPDFAAAMIACYPVFFAEEWTKAVEATFWPAGRVAACGLGWPACLDWRGATRSLLPSERLAEAEGELRGAAAARAVLHRLPLAWPLWAVLALLARLGIGHGWWAEARARIEPAELSS